MNMNETIAKMEKRFENIETTLDSIANNHLAHVERYTKWSLVGILISTGLSMTAVLLTVL